MAVYSGMDGSVDLSAVGAGINQVKEFTVNDEIDTERTINFDDDEYESVLTGAKRWSGSLTADFDGTVPKPGDKGHAILVPHQDVGDWNGTIVVSSISNSVTKGAGVIEVSMDFEGDGALGHPGD